MDPIVEITKSIGEIRQLAEQGNVEVTRQLSALSETTSGLNQRLLDAEQKISAAARGGNLVQRSSGRMALGEVVAADPRLDALRKGEIHQARITQKASLATLCKSVLVQTGTSGASPEFGFPTPTEFVSPVPLSAPGRRLQVLSSLPHLNVNAGTAMVPSISGTTDGSAVQEFQGGSKGESTLAVHPLTLPMATVATFLNASRQLLDDVSTLPAFLQIWLSYFVLRRYESLIVAGDGSATDGHITGLLNAGTAFTSAQTYNADKIGDAAFNALPSYGYAADICILNSSDWFNIVSQRATTEQYAAGGGWAAPSPSTLWGIKAVATPALPSGHAIVADSQLINILDRQEIAFLIGNVNDQFQRNEFCYLAELRG